MSDGEENWSLGVKELRKKSIQYRLIFFFLELHLPRSIATSSLFCGNPGDVDVDVELRISSSSSSTVLGLGVMYESDEELSQ